MLRESARRLQRRALPVYPPTVPLVPMLVALVLPGVPRKLEGGREAPVSSCSLARALVHLAAFAVSIAVVSSSFSLRNAGIRLVSASLVGVVACVVACMRDVLRAVEL